MIVTQAIRLGCAALLFGVLNTSELNACSCRPASGYAAVAVPLAATTADFAFLGTANGEAPSSRGQDGYIEFTPVRWWRGPEQRPDTIRIRHEGTLCDVHFAAGETAVIYANGPAEDGLLESSTCALMTRTRSVEEEVAILDAMNFSKPDTWSTDFFAYGCGGGVAARYELSVVFRDGRLSQGSHSLLGEEETSVTFLEPDLEFARAVFAELKAIDLETVNNLNEPASYYCYFEASLDGRKFRATWGGGGGQVPEGLESLGELLEAGIGERVTNDSHGS